MNTDLLRTIDPVPDEPTDFDPEIRDALLRSIVTSGQLAERTSAGPARLGRRVGALVATGVALLALGAGTAVALGVFRSPRNEALTYCSLPGEGLVDVAGPTGDPVENCRVAWRHATGDDPPPLVAHQGQSGRVEVYPAGHPAPEGYQRLPTGSSQDPEVILLDEAFGDYIDGLSASCLDERQARAKAASIIDETGLSGWSVAEGSDPGDYGVGTTLCWQAAADPRDHAVHIQADPADPGASVKMQSIVTALRPSLTECWSMQTAAERVQRAIDDSDFPDAAKRTFTIRQVAEPRGDCTTVHANAAGTVTFTLRGRD